MSVTQVRLTDVNTESAPDGQVPTVVGGVLTYESPGSVLPDQSGHGGDVLTTDGSAASWETPENVLPDQAGNAGKFLKTDGAADSWQSITQDDIAPGFAISSF